MTRRLVAIGAIVVCAACGKTPNVEGDWQGRVAPAHFDYLLVRITQDGSVLRGSACYVVVPGSTTGGVVFKDATVSGMYPTFTVSTTALNGFTFTGSFNDNPSVDGAWRTASEPNYPMSLTRGASIDPSQCFQ